MSDNNRQLTFFGKVFRALLPLLLILGGGAAWSYFKATAPTISKAKPKLQAYVVETGTATLGNARALVSVMGTVAAAREVTLTAQVSGVVQSVSDRFVPGCLMAQGEELIYLDPADYKVEVKKAQSSLANAKAALAIELGSQNIAREEVRLLSVTSNQKVSQTDLALRKPQLEQAQADVTSAEADLTQAMLDLGRTRIKAPFNAMIVERSVNVGSYVGAQDSLATLVGTDEFWVEAVVPLDQLAYIDVAHPGGCPVKIRSQSGTGTWKGRVLQVSGKLNETSRMATVIISVRTPLGTPNTPSASPLMIDDYVYVDITGRILSNVVSLPRAALQDNDTVWINRNDTLDIRKVTLAWKGKENVYVKTGIQPGESVVMSNLSTPVQGMSLKTVSETRAQKTQSPAPAAPSITTDKQK